MSLCIPGRIAYRRCIASLNSKQSRKPSLESPLSSSQGAALRGLFEALNVPIWSLEYTS
jgi:hypothetical protein